jgi:hypothetical protein
VFVVAMMGGARRDIAPVHALRHGVPAIGKLPVVPICRRQPSLQFLQIRSILVSILPRARGAHRDRHDARGGDAVDVTALTDERRMSRTSEVVWSWRAHAGAKFERSRKASLG